jgi:hypothetical protein
VTKAKRHHFVPRAYLERFGREGRVAVRWRGHSKPVVAGAHNVAVEGGFYETVDAKGQKSVEAEEALAVVDGQAINAMRAIVDAGEPPPTVGRSLVPRSYDSCRASCVDSHQVACDTPAT